MSARGGLLGRKRCEIRTRREKGVDLIFMLFAKQRAGHIGDAPAQLHIARRCFEKLALLLETLVDRAWREAPFGVGVTAPRAGSGARRVDQHETATPLEIGQHVGLAFRRADLHVARAGALQPHKDRREPAAVGVMSVDLAAVVHLRGERQSLAAAAGAKVEDLLAGLGAAKQRRELRAFVLRFDEAFDESGLGREHRAASVGAGPYAQSERREWRRFGMKMRELFLRLVARAFEDVDAEIDWRPFGERRAL